MTQKYNRYDSGMMLPPVNNDQKWLEAQRIMADIIDQHEIVEHDMPGSRVVYSEGEWKDERGRGNDFVLERYIGYDKGQLHTTFLLTVDEIHRTQKTYYIDASDEVDVRGAGESPQGLEQRRTEVYRIMASVTLHHVMDDTHFTFEKMVTEMAAQETPFSITAPMMNWDSAAWDAFVEEYKQKRKIHRQSRINPVYLSPGAYNSQYQLQLGAADEFRH